MTEARYTDTHGNDLSGRGGDDLVAEVTEGRRPGLYGLCQSCGQWYHVDDVHMAYGGGCRGPELRGRS